MNWIQERTEMQTPRIPADLRTLQKELKRLAEKAMDRNPPPEKK
ncbi:MAG: hypothetical protein N2C14_25540 [Planctomycetales bacterium]